ncbi:MAG: hypothetical protein WKF77_29295 [Planctomycetaceae bacterium]
MLNWYGLIVQVQTLSRIGRNELPASATQRRRLQWILIATIILVQLMLLGFRLLQQNY